MLLTNSYYEVAAAWALRLFMCPRLGRGWAKTIACHEGLAGQAHTHTLSMHTSIIMSNMYLYKYCSTT